MSQYFSPKEVAKAVGVSESSMKRWVDRGLIEASKTAGGHRRVQLHSVLSFLRKTGKPILDPQAITLPEGVGQDQPANIDEARRRYLKAMVDGDENLAVRVAIGTFVAGHSIAEICDQVITPSFHDLGNLWECGDVKIYQERRACEVCQRTLHELRRVVNAGDPERPVAMGGTLDGDPYTIASAMSELVLRDAGWRASSLGNMLPFEAIRIALTEQRPKLFWVSVTAIRDPSRFVAEFNLMFDVAQSTETALVVGGQGLTTQIRQQIRYSQFSDTFGHLETFAGNLLQAILDRSTVATNSDHPVAH